MATLQLKIDFAVFSDFDFFDFNKFLADFTFNLSLHHVAINPKVKTVAIK